VEEDRAIEAKRWSRAQPVSLDLKHQGVIAQERETLLRDDEPDREIGLITADQRPAFPNNPFGPQLAPQRLSFSTDNGRLLAHDPFPLLPPGIGPARHAIRS
jgi:hypothetical protein